jgi:hypothetical protein
MDLAKQINPDDPDARRSIIDMGDGTYGVVRGDKLVHKGLASETTALRMAAKEYIEERAVYLVNSALDHAVKLAFDSWKRASVHLLPAGVTRDKLAELIRKGMDCYFAPGKIEADLTLLHESELEGPASTVPGLGED